jgi:hypothetical protein
MSFVAFNFDPDPDPDIYFIIHNSKHRKYASTRKGAAETKTGR